MRIVVAFVIVAGLAIGALFWRAGGGGDASRMTLVEPNPALHSLNSPVLSATTGSTSTSAPDDSRHSGDHATADGQRLEAENAALREEVRALRQALREEREANEHLERMLELQSLRPLVATVWTALSEQRAEALAAVAQNDFTEDLAIDDLGDLVLALNVETLEAALGKLTPDDMVEYLALSRDRRALLRELWGSGEECCGIGAGEYVSDAEDPRHVAFQEGVQVQIDMWRGKFRALAGIDVW